MDNLNNFLKETNKNNLNEYLNRDRVYIPTGVKHLDTLLDGYYPGTVWIIGGWPGTGKTTFCINLLSKLKKVKVSVFDTETSKYRYLEKLMCCITGTKDRDIRIGVKLAVNVLQNNLHLLDEYDLNVIDKSNPSLKDIEEEMKERNPKIVIVDYFQNMEIPENLINRYGAFTNLARNIEKLTKKYGCTTILTSQLKKPDDVNTRPTLFDLKETGKLGEMAHVVGLLSKTKNEEEGELFVDIQKCRDGQLGSFTLKGQWESNRLF